MAQTGLTGATLSVPWPPHLDQVGVAVENEAGHWVRAPFETVRPARGRIVDLLIDDLAGLLEDHGMELEFWMIVDGIRQEPRWVLTRSVSTSDGA